MRGRGDIKVPPPSPPVKKTARMGGGSVQIRHKLAAPGQNAIGNSSEYVQILGATQAYYKFS